MELLETLKAYKSVVAERKRLEQEAKTLKEMQEAPLKEQILQYLFEHGIQSVHFPEVGRIVKVTKTHYEIQDKELYAHAVLQSLVEAAEEGRPLSDGLLAQFRVAKDVFADYIARHGGQPTGVVEAVTEELSIRKS